MQNCGRKGDINQMLQLVPFYRLVMASSTPVLLRLLATSYSASAKAGQIVRDVMANGDMGIVEKGKNDLQTLADTSAQRCIFAALAKNYPKATIIGEGGSIKYRRSCIKEEDVTIWVDPLDGTKEYTE
ncbi:hypothetical protein GE061_001223, partial [Apolygus lucorum]